MPSPVKIKPDDLDNNEDNSICKDVEALDIK